MAVILCYMDPAEATLPKALKLNKRRRRSTEEIR